MALADAMGDERLGVAVPPHSTRLTCTVPVGLKSIAARQSSASNICFVSCLKSWGPEPYKLPSLCCRIARKVHPIVSVHFVIKKSRDRANRVELGVGRPVKRCIVEVSGLFSLYIGGRSGEGCHSAN